MSQTFTPFLTFQNGQAEAAMTFYCSVFPDSQITRINRYTVGMPGPEGTVITAEFTLGGRTFMASDSFITHDWDFTPAISVYVECQSRAELEAAFAALSEGGRVYMPADNYGFSQLFGWVGDRFGVTWQLNLA
ncbi:3-demethylubiquinone-9 3-methyltransferase [Devosia epidermidihirudinis]|uniref:3-demethylubiquinone-9 3-methyltransferase n=1 Tax=Devosia epidermidihirudinis TaxID=1293439 RepID=A0A0F5Q2W1_9HYPH|nr:VOC family protein [Devosia epidermidihirudinis]KKC35237.1 3-demethylubiquinone-9 3-methyltransferase [Devosia epidermidihirudinis]